MAKKHKNPVGRSMQEVSTIGRVRRNKSELTPVSTLGRRRPL